MSASQGAGPALLADPDGLRLGRGDRLIAFALFCAAAVSLLSVLSIFAFLLWFSLPLFADGQLAALLTWHWQPLQGQFGILPMVVGSLFLGSSALLLAFPLGLGVCCFAHGVGPGWLARPLLAAIRLMTSVPTVVYGLVSVFLLVPMIRDGFSGSGFSWLAALLTLALLILPTIVLLIDGQFSQVGCEIRMTAAALGFSHTQQLLRLTLPLSSRGLVVAAVLGFARAVGDTLIPLMLAGNAVKVPHSLLDPLRTLTAHVALVVATDSQSAAYNALFACGVILFVFSMAVNFGLHRLHRRSAQRHG
jgi:phosphate transport system permease protein